MEIAAAKQARKKQERELAKLVRKRDTTVAGSKVYQQLNQQIKTLREQLKPNVSVSEIETEDIDQYNYSGVRPNNEPRRPPSRPAASTRRTPTPFSIGEIPEYLDSLSRGERKKAETAIRQYMTGPRKLNSLEALAAYKERKRRDAQAPVGATEFDDSGDEDQDLGGFGSGRTIDGMGDGSRYVATLLHSPVGLPASAYLDCSGSL